VSDPARAPAARSPREALFFVAALASTSAESRTAYASLKKGLRAAVASDPLDATLLTVGGGAFLFYLAEKDHNPKVRTYWDALVFVSTCLSVGYADVFARTSAGKAIASALMTLGPAMSGALLDEPRQGAGPAGDATPVSSAQVLALQNVIAEKLEAILGELRKA
jgi:voltage-gated potassium channel